MESTNNVIQRHHRSGKSGSVLSDMTDSDHLKIIQNMECDLHYGSVVWVVGLGKESIPLRL